MHLSNKECHVLMFKLWSLNVYRLVLQVIMGIWVSITSNFYYNLKPKVYSATRDLISQRLCTPLHCLCNAYLGCAYPCWQVALQSVAISNTLG